VGTPRQPGTPYQGSSAPQGVRQQSRQATPTAQSRTGRGGTSGTGQGRGQADPSAQGRVFLLDAPEQQPDTSVVRGTVLVYNTWARVLFDTGASHSFIALSFARALGLPVDQLAQPLCVETPVGGVVTLGSVCRACDLMIFSIYLSFDLIILDMHSFDVILGMDWLSVFRATIDCYTCRVTMHVSSGYLCTFVGEREDPSITLRL
ncbi:retroviral-like aspartic protease family protein, partial [Bartonella sp. AC140YNZD]|uniref:retroviral-like aspartic protease family protein n=1 Tax=Bartonella sp. AC140YNZD TaxID=3243447 RepID=UPI0035CF0CA6